MTMAQGAALSAVVSGSENPGSLARLIASLRTTMAGAPVELLLTSGTQPAVPDLPANWQCRWLPTDRSMLVPDQWGVGLRAATAPLVGFFTPDLLPTPAWWPTVSALTGIAAVAGAAGGIALGARTVRSAGIYLTRYSRFFPGGQDTPVEVDHLPGEVSLYRREALLAHPDLVARGFWEVEYHGRLVRDGWQLLFSPDVLAECHASPSTVAMMQQRCEHARQYGASLVRRNQHSRLQVALGAPLVPLLLTARSLRRAWGNPWGRPAVALGLAPLLLYTMAWGFGEAIGAWRSGRGA